MTILYGTSENLLICVETDKLEWGFECLSVFFDNKIILKTGINVKNDMNSNTEIGFLKKILA